MASSFTGKREVSISCCLLKPIEYNYIWNGIYYQAGRNPALSRLVNRVECLEVNSSINHMGR